MKTAVVTGTSYGLGKTIAEMFLSEGFKVYGISRTKSEFQNKNFVWIKADLLGEKSFELINSSISEDKIDLLVNNAGVVFAEKSLEFKTETFDNTFGINLIAPVKLTKILKYKLQSGMVANISSTSDRFLDEGTALYSASKSALEVYFDGVALENKDIKIINILPAYVDTPMLRTIAGKLKFSLADATNPNDVASAIGEILLNHQELESGSRVITTSNKSYLKRFDSEKLYYYNVNTKEFKKLK